MIILRGAADRIIRDIPDRPSTVLDQVMPIIDMVKNTGDDGLAECEKKFNGAAHLPFRINPDAIRAAYDEADPDAVEAVRFARDRLLRTESAMHQTLSAVTTRYGHGTTISRRFLPIPSVGCYIPGGGARYPSSAVMSITPAKAAGVPRIVAVSPPDKDGKLDPLTLVAADMCGVDEIYRAGGAQSIAALAYGTDSIKPVSKIVGPGGPYVSAAKCLISERVPIDMVAGPTELGVILDSPADIRRAARSLISQAEHSADTFCFALSTADIADDLQAEINGLLDTAERSHIARASLERGIVAICDTEPDVAAVAEHLAPEHLEVFGNTKHYVGSAGLVLYGVPSAATDYAMGTNHILPTNRHGRARGSLSALDFLKLHTDISSHPLDLAEAARHIRHLARAEGLPNHYEAVLP